MSCPNHGPEGCCFECIKATCTDGVGFPHPSECKGKTALRRCVHCGSFVQREQWRCEQKMPYRDGCSTCLPTGDPVGPFPGRIPKR